MLHLSLNKFSIYILLFLFSSNSFGQNCDDLYLSYDSLEAYQIGSEKQRLKILNDINASCPEYVVGYLQRRGYLFERHKQVDSALNFYFKALKEIDLLRQYKYLNSVLMNIGNVHLSIEQFDQALKYYKMDTVRRLEGLNSYNKSVYYYNRADIYSKLGLTSLALYDLNMSERYTDLADTNELVSLKLLECEILRNAGEYDKAYKVINTISSYGFPGLYEYNKVTLLRNLIYFEELLNIRKLNIGLVDSLIAMTENLDDENQLALTLRDMASVLEFSGDTNRALKVLKQYNRLNDKLKKQSINASIQLAEFNIQNELNTKNLKLSKATLELRNNQLVMMGVGLLLVVALTLGGWRYFNQKQKLNKQAIIIKENEKRSLIQEQDMKFLLAQMKGQIDERRRIAADLHNTMGNRLASIKLKFENLEEQGSNSKDFKESIRLLNSQIDQACIKLREISHEHYDRTWMHELRNRLEQVNETHNIKATLIDNAINLSDFPALEVCLFTISEGLISNTIRHSQATEITIQLIDVDNELSYSYEDNGRGFDKDILSNTDGIGYRIIKEKVEELNGTWDLDTAPGRGMTLFINIPLLT